MKKLRLHRSPFSKEAITAIASETLRTGGWVEAPPAELKPGDRMSDGTIFAGISPEIGEPMYAAPADSLMTCTFNEAQKYAEIANKQKPFGRDDWRVPSKAELNVLFNNRAVIGGFDISSSNPAGWYWSSLQFGEWNAWGQRFSDGAHNVSYKDTPSSVRLVRSVPSGPNRKS